MIERSDTLVAGSIAGLLFALKMAKRLRHRLDQGGPIVEHALGSGRHRSSVA